MEKIWTTFRFWPPADAMLEVKEGSMNHRTWKYGVMSIAFVPLSLFAQTLSQITGEITDESQASVPGAAVTLTHPATGAKRATASNAAGIYSFPALLPGIYDLKIEKPGFRTTTRTGIEVEVQQTARFDFTLQIGQATEVVRVTGEAPLSNTEDATVGAVIDNRRIAELPLNGRNFLQLVSLSPHVSFGFNNGWTFGPIGPAVRQGGSRVEQNIAVAGQRSQANRFSLDGVENTDVNFNTYIVLPSIDALQEFKVQSGVYPAEFGRQASQINVSTKSGGNQFHGALFEFLRNDKLDAKAYAFTASRPPKERFKWNQYGFVLSGPVWIPKLFHGRNRLFFLSNFEGYRDRKRLRGVFNVPSLAMREGDFSAIGARLFDPATRAGGGGQPITAEPFPGNLIPKSRIHPTSLALLEFLPEPNVTGGSLLSNYQAGMRREIDKDQFLQRIDFVETNASTWFGRYSWGDELQISPTSDLVPRANGTKLQTNVRQAMVSNTRVFSPALVNEFRFGYSSFFNTIGHEMAFVRDVLGELKIPGIPSLPPVAWGLPYIRLLPDTTFGSTGDGPYTNDNRIFQWVDNLSWTQGRHSLRFGAEIRRDHYNHAGYSLAQGRFFFENRATQNPSSPAGTGQSFADFLLGTINNSDGAAGVANARFRATSQYYYLDDSWKLRSNLTLSLGLRYENSPPWFDESGLLINAHFPVVDTTPNVPDRSRHPTLVRMGRGDFYEGLSIRFHPAIQVARDGRLGERLVERDNNDIAPRVGVAWSPTMRWTVRAGFGLFYSQDTGNPRVDMSRNSAGRRADFTNTDFPDLTWDRPYSGLDAVQINTPFVLANIHQRRTPYSFQYLLNIQRELGKDTLLDVGYLGTGGRKLEMLIGYNQALPGATSGASRRPYPEFGIIQQVDGSGKSSYNALGAKLHRRFQSGLTYVASYTWSRSIDNSSAIRPHYGDFGFPQNSYCVRCERALSSFHTSHRLAVSTLYELPLGRGRKDLASDLLLRGWQLGSILTLQTGFPFTVSSGSDRANVGGPILSRADATGENPDLPRGRQDPERFFNTAAFTLQPLGRFGNSGRNAVIGPGLIVWDFSVLKDLRLWESHRLQFRLEAFNLPNHPNWGTPGFTITGVDFGKIRSTRTPMRELQFGLKYLF